MSNPPSQDSFHQVIRRQVVPRQPARPSSRPIRWSRLFFLLFCGLFLLVVLMMIKSG